MLVVLSLGLFTVSGTTLWWMLHAWRSPDALAATGFRRRAAGAPRSFSLLLPARHEQDVLGDTIDALARLDHPNYEVIVIIGHDDPETEFVARESAERHPGIVKVVMDHNVPKNKPKALNTALPKCRGDIVGVFDAEDEVHPGLLRLVEARFEESGADVVQAGVQLMNVQTSWWSLRNCLEYYFWFRSRLHFHAEKRFIPLGGNTVFIRTELLREVDGWDPDCLAEDCEIGVRLSTRGAVVAVAYDPQAVTREKNPGSIRALVKQRTRWDQGFLQVFRKGEWRRLPSRRQRWLARYTLAMPMLQAATGVLMPLSLATMFLLKVPMPIALVTFFPLAPTLVTMAVESAALGEFGREFGIRIRARDHARLLLGTVPYQLLLAAAAVRSLWREGRGQGGWRRPLTPTPTAPPPSGRFRHESLIRLNPSVPILGILLMLTAALRLINFTGSPARFHDEGTYMAQAYAIAEWEELAHYTYWYDHPPAGWLQLALWTTISGPDFGGNAVAAGRYLMVIVAVITAALLWAWRAESECRGGQPRPRSPSLRCLRWQSR